MKKIIFLITSLILSNKSYCQIDTIALMQNVKVRLIDDFSVGFLSQAQYKSYCTLPLKFELLDSKDQKGFKSSVLFAMIPEQILYTGDKGEIKFTSPSSFIDSPFTSSFLVCIDMISRKIYPLLGFQKDKIEQLIYDVTAFSNIKSKLKYINNEYKISGFHFENVNNKIQLVADKIPYQSTPYLKACFDDVTKILEGK